MIRMRYLLFCFILTNTLHAQTEIYPPHWWAGMKNTSLQLMIHGNQVGLDKPVVSVKYPGIQVTKVHYAENPNYIFVDLTVTPKAAPGEFNIQLTTKSNTTSLLYTLKPRRNGKGTTFAQGVNSRDLIYLLMPDRFSNGDPSNDRIAGLRDQTLNRDSIYHRHGGDLQGVINHLDYLKDLGVTSLWMTPVLLNDMPNRTEHGYAITNHYVIEPRFGGEEQYKKLSYELHQRGMKLIQDAVYNHVGLYHFTVQDKPMKDWLHEWPTYTNTTYKDQTLFDAYASTADRKRMADGWFTPQMPDLNHQNPFVANFLIQHAIYSVEEFGVDGWRIDTYIYNDLAFMNACNKALLDEYPQLTLFGETWVHGVINQAFFTENNLQLPFKSNLPAVTDFQALFYGIQPALNERFGWTEGVNKLYQTLSNDIVYKDPMKQVIFLDNHDLNRFFSVVNEDMNKIRIAYSWLLTCRGIPQLYYGGEILMKGFTNPDGWVRLDFQGGWPEDMANKFTAAGRTENEQELFILIRTLANYRKTSSALTTGKFMHYLPVEGVYVYFRYDASQTVMCIMNTSDKPTEIDFGRYTERTTGFSKAVDILTRETKAIREPMSVMPMTLRVLELQK